jgi:hypothetical protein
MKSYVDHRQCPTSVGHNDTNSVLSVGLQWTIAIQLVLSIARQVIFEDFVICTATEDEGEISAYGALRKV